MVMGIIVQPVGNNKAVPVTVPVTTSSSTNIASAVPSHVNSASPIPKSPSYHCNLDQAAGLDGNGFSFSKASLDTLRTTNSSTVPENSYSDKTPDGRPASQFIGLSTTATRLASPFKRRDRNAYTRNTSHVVELGAIKGGLFGLGSVLYLLESLLLLLLWANNWHV